MKVLMYSSFCKLMPTTKNTILDLLNKDVRECKVLFIPLASDSKSYITMCYNSLIKLGFKTENIISISPLNQNETFDVVFTCGGNNAVLKEKLLKFNWWQKLKELIVNDVLYIGDSAGSVLLGSEFGFTLEYEPYNGPLKDYSGFSIIDKYVVVHYSLLKLRTNGRLDEDKVEYDNHHNVVVKYGKEKCLTIGNNEFYKITDDYCGLFTFDWEEVRENYLSEN